jgi:biotin synthase
MERDEIVSWLRETDPSRLAELWRMADDVRQQQVGGEVHLRGLIEFSNHCVRLCAYCGLRAPNKELTRYRMSAEEIMACAGQAVDFGYGTVILQSGEDPGVSTDWIGDLVRRIKGETPLAVTLSLGERTDQELAAWRRAGADRYLLRFETSNRTLYEQVHPSRPGETRDRLAILHRLRELGYDLESGVLIGIPGQTFDDVACDIELFAELGLEMIHCGPYVMLPDTPLRDPEFRPIVPDDDQVPASDIMTHKMIALSRLKCPGANVSTTTPGTRDSDPVQELGLVRGANAILPNLTPSKYRASYELYANKECVSQSPDGCHTCVTRRIEAIGRHTGPGAASS